MIQQINMPRLLGYAGAIPFIALSLFRLISSDSPFDVSYFLFGYGVIILSFLGGLHWGRIAAQTDGEKPNPYILAYSVFPALIGWFALMVPETIGIALLILSFGICGVTDIRLTLSGVFARWMLELRIVLSIVAMLSLASLYL